MSCDPEPDRPLYPPEGQSGPFRMRMFRGVRTTDRLHEEYTSDPGDYGRGEYWTDMRDMAEQSYAKGGEVHEAVITLQNALRLSGDQVIRYGREVYGFLILEDGPERRLAAAERFTADMKAAGYDGVVTYGYEGFGEWGACVFSNDQATRSAERGTGETSSS